MKRKWETETNIAMMQVAQDILVVDEKKIYFTFFKNWQRFWYKNI